MKSDDERLRRESPAYRPDATWEIVEPQALDVVVSVRFDADSARRVAQLAGATGRTPSRLLRDWTLERLVAGTTDAPRRSAGIRESPVAYSADDSVGYEQLRQQYRPQERIRLLLVGESRPARGSFFYLANSNLYRATLEAWQAAFGPMPEGESLLRRLQSEGVWLYDLAPAPVNRLRGRPRRGAVTARSGDLAALLAAESPDAIVVVKRSLAAVVRDAMSVAHLPAEQLHVLPFPLYQWRAEYVAQLSVLFEDVVGRVTRFDAFLRVPDLRAGLRREQLESLWLHRAVAGRVVQDPANALAQARANLDQLSWTHPSAGPWLDGWRHALDAGPEEVLQVLTSPAESAVELRQNSPFAGVVDEADRSRVLDAFRQYWAERAER